jgi:hypothetical protein
MLRKAAEADPGKTAIVQGGCRIRYGELDALAGPCAAGLRRSAMPPTLGRSKSWNLAPSGCFVAPAELEGQALRKMN